jgi:ABC-type branched-subunit amino acid transport system ATPase component
MSVTTIHRAATAASMPALRVESLRAGYQGSQIVRGVSLDVGPTEILAIVGRNGVGKTTLVKTIVGLVPIGAGRLVLGGSDVSRLSAVQRVRRGIGYVPQGRGIFTRLTVAENLRMGAMVGGGPSSHAEPECRDAERRRAADAVHRSRPERKAQPPHSRRAIGRRAAEHRRTDRRRHP